MHIATNRDVWGHIVQYYRVSFSDDSARELKISRSTLLAIALASSELTAVAVAELWRSVKTLEPIIHAFNPPPFQAVSPAFEYKHDDFSDYWEIVRAPDSLTNGVRSRILDYLSYVQYLHFPIYPSSKERTLWQALQAFNWINPLCPNLRGITFTAGGSYPCMNYHLVPLLVPSVRSIRFDSATTDWDEAAVSMLLSLIQHRDVHISDISFTGHASRRVVKQIFQFPRLKFAKLINIGGLAGFMTVSDVGCFGSSSFLTNLDIDLGIFQSTLNLGEWIESLQSLSTLSLLGEATAIIECLQNRSYAAVHSLSLFLRVPVGTPDVEPNIFAIISTTFPILNSLFLENKEDRDIMTTAITLSDIYAFRSRKMRSLVISRLRWSLTHANVIDFIRTWPTLERLGLVPHPKLGFEGYRAFKLLVYISGYAPHITDLKLPLSMSSLVTIQPLITRPTVCPLQRLELPEVQNLPSSLKGKLMLCQNLVTLFPRLNAVTSDKDVQEIQAIVESFRGVLSSPPMRGDNLY